MAHLMSLSELVWFFYDKNIDLWKMLCYNHAVDAMTGSKDPVRIGGS